MRKWNLVLALGALALLLTPAPAMATVACNCQDIGTVEDGQMACNVTSTSGLTGRDNPAGGPCGTMNGVECNGTTFNAQLISDTCGVAATDCNIVAQGNQSTSQYQENFTDADNSVQCSLGPGSPLPVELVEFTVD